MKKNRDDSPRNSIVKKLIIIFSTVLLLLATGCILSDDKKKDDPPEDYGNTADNEIIEKYYPIQIGALWEYEASVTRSGAHDTTYADTYAIVDTITYNDRLYYVEHRDIGGLGMLSLYLRTEGNILYGIYPNETEELTYLNFNLGFGDSWNPTATTLPETFEGFIDVDSPAGTFENCMKFQAEGYVIENGMVIYTVVKEYYAAHVGRVKSVIIKTDTEDMIVFSENVILISYEIPG